MYLWISREIFNHRNLPKKISDYPFLIQKLPQKSNLPQFKKHCYFRYFDNFYEAKVLIAINNINYAYLAADHSLFMVLVLDTLVDISSLLN